MQRLDSDMDTRTTCPKCDRTSDTWIAKFDHEKMVKTRPSYSMTYDYKVICPQCGHSEKSHMFYMTDDIWAVTETATMGYVYPDNVVLKYGYTRNP